MSSRLCRAVVSALVGMAVLGGAARADLASYVKKAEPKYRWELKSNSDQTNGKVYNLTLVSQVWQGIPWTHDLQVFVPKEVKPGATVFLWNTGGKPGPFSAVAAWAMARSMQAPVVFLWAIPNQPLLGKLKEDALIAETFVRYLKTKDEDWPLLFPMVKSVVKAMDAVQEFAKKEWKADVKQFVVSGGSKRGWTTWLTATVDPRVKAIAPAVIDTLNMQKQLPHQLESYGAYSLMIHDYTSRNLVPPPRTPEGKKLWSLVDPWVYRDRLTLPKLILNGTNDPYWTQDALNLYWDDLKGDKWVCYVPNAGHDLVQRGPGGQRDLSRASGALAAFMRAQVEDRPLPKLRWKHTQAGDKYRLEVTSDPAPKAARLWQADAATRDFRKGVWKDEEVKLDGGSATGTVAAPARGCRVFFVECEYQRGTLRYYLSTQLRIVGTPEKPPQKPDAPARQAQKED
jgi:PhoPQ-activated pathogenicity-related protein